MNQLLKLKECIQTDAGMNCDIEQFLGGGGQGEVYKAILSGNPVALKWYYPQQASQEQKNILDMLIKKGSPNDNFLWPMGIVSSQKIKGFGYFMPLRESRYKSITDLMKRRIEPSFRALAAAGLELAHSFLQLHAKGLCYRDISFGNVFFDPETGDILICDNDNVVINGQSKGGVLGTPKFMAPEIVRGEAFPDTQTDLFSLAVLLFYMFMVHHPLEGKKEFQIRCFDLPAMNKLYGTEPVFIFDPNDDSNRPEPGYHDNAEAYWRIYPKFLKDTFSKAFTDGIRDPQHGRVRESEWRSEMAKLKDSIIYCGNCGSENFYDVDELKNSGNLNPCWSCQKILRIPPRIRIEKNIVMLNHNTNLYPHHIDPQKTYDFSKPVAGIVQHPKDPNIWGLKNISDEKWSTTAKDGSVKEINPGQSLTLATEIEINFGKAKGEIRI